MGRAEPLRTPAARLGVSPSPPSRRQAFHASILGVAAVGLAPAGEAAAQKAVLSPLAGDVVHPDPPRACKDRDPVSDIGTSTGISMWWTPSMCVTSSPKQLG